MKFKKWLFYQLNDQKWSRRELSFINSLIILLILASVFLQVIETDKALFNQYQIQFFYADLFFALFFTLEFVLRLWAVGVKYKYRGLSGKIKYLKTRSALLDILTLIPFYFTIGSTSWLCGALRTTRIIIIIRYEKIFQAFKILFRTVSTRKYEFLVSLIIFCFLMLASATALYITESETQPATFGSIPKALWWSIVTLGGIGYGDAYPITKLGKLCASISILLAIVVVSLPTGIIAATFSENLQKKFEK